MRIAGVLLTLSSICMAAEIGQEGVVAE